MLADKTILLVEDDPVVASALLFSLEESEANVAGPVRRVRTAMREVERQPPDAAILDVELLDGEVFPVADRLREQGVPFVFYTARGSQGHDAAHDMGAPVIGKGQSTDAAVERLKALIADGAD